MKIVKVYDLVSSSYHHYEVPSTQEALEQSKKTWGKQYDRIEGKVVEGGIPFLWKRSV